MKLFNRESGAPLEDLPVSVGPFGDAASGQAVSCPMSDKSAPFQSVFSTIPIAPGAVLDIQVLESTAHDCRHFLIQKRTKQTLFMPEKLNKEISDYLGVTKSSAEAAVRFKRGSPVACHTSKGWVRGEIVSIRSVEQFLVYHVDEGKTMSYHKKDLIPLPRIFIDRQPAQAIACSLVGVILPAQEELANHVFKNFLAENHTLSGAVLGQVRTGPNKTAYVVNIFSASASLRDELAEHGCASRDTIHIPPPPFYLSTWLHPHQHKRGVEINVTICAVSDFYSQKVSLSNPINISDSSFC